MYRCPGLGQAVKVIHPRNLLCSTEIPCRNKDKVFNTYIFFSRVVCAGGKVGNPICPTPRLTVPKDATSKAPSHGTEVADFFLLSACEALE